MKPVKGIAAMALGFALAFALAACDLAPNERINVWGPNA